MEPDDQIESLLNVLSQGVYEKEHIIAMSLLSAIAGESIFLLGPPGTAKSLVARRLKLAFKDGKAFEYLMSRFSTPDEIFGPVSISMLKNEDRYERVVEGFLPTATVVFLDEIWKAGPSIQNALLTAINERIFQNGRTTLKLPMKALIAASNELPAEGEGLEALWDRFLVRMVSNCIQSESVFYKMIRQKNLNPTLVPEYLLISEELYAEWQRKIEEVEISNEVCSIITYIRKRLKAEIKKENVEEMDYYISDRRWKKCVHLLQSSAFLNGRKQIDLTDIPILIHCLWKVVKYGKDIDQALNCIRKNTASSNSQEIDEDNYVQVNFFYYNVLKYYKGKTLFYKMDYSHVPSNQTCNGILYYDETKQAHIIHAIYTGQLYDYKMKNTQEVNKVKLSKCHGGIVIDNIPYAFQTKRANAEPTIFNQPGCPSPNTALKILNDIRNELLVKLSDQQKLFDYYRNLFLSDDDIKIVKQYLSQCEKSLKEMEVKAQNASLLLC